MQRFLHCFCVFLCLAAASGTGYSASAPQVIAHRGGTGDAPENTVIAVDAALRNGADAVWVTLQEAKDGVIVLYRPTDLKALTNKQGPISAYTGAELANVDAGWAFDDDTHHPYRGKGVGIPRLDTVLRAFPQVPFYLDIKSPDADPIRFGEALLKTLQETGSLSRTRVYSTDARYLEALPPQISRFETRDRTRTLLANVSMAHRCDPLPATQAPHWYGLELRREVEVVEHFTLGEGRSKTLLTWDKEAMDCFRSAGTAQVILFGINTPADYQRAQALGADGVLVDSPRSARAFRQGKAK
ncbi:glycerophosphodiester phosphodiesterase [Lonsdalea populi]|uniref:Glycerophosphodiester phosphodiesterase n=1 Tax=Lonsdalea populi TaxID=1172565 RepID=A0A3N0UR76_9GAMM|nr:MULTISPECIES: glycerophosphodiester phosphodiesterase family protein [Lonsdalea]RAT15275.1 glycerophosphodiester phosphodiesterase [Lonsdalea quercina]RAT29272.1 glycerophosphodiester phosphodiesterase [Lonsdalea populi]RAT38648.1 glycerophosphodiester phosphodiesterase [Lonsdalea populi]RAT47246.1 glycerophosphodiester phosphodiesterase [Lonsdalea populi]RAT52296.1 glycerophosphodiester phosphodiesterase [Lonsdalea populi]